MQKTSPPKSNLLTMMMRREINSIAEEFTLVPCGVCSGSGSVTDDPSPISLALVMEEIERDEEEGISSRTRLAVEQGAIRFVSCSACRGEGMVPV